jgi:hypothetical protein
MCMLKTIQEYLIAFGKWGYVLAVILFGDIVGIIQSYYQRLILPQWAWWTLLVIILTLSPILAFHKLRTARDELLKEINNIRNERPQIEAAIRQSNNEYKLEILNIGEAAEFEAQIKILNGIGFINGCMLPDYTASWETTLSNKSELKKGQRDWLRIATLQISGVNPFMNYHLHYQTTLRFENSPMPFTGIYQTTTWIPGNSTTVAPNIVLQITIISKPTMVNGPYIRKYQLSNNGLIEI